MIRLLSLLLRTTPTTPHRTRTILPTPLRVIGQFIGKHLPVQSVMPSQKTDKFSCFSQWTRWDWEYAEWLRAIDCSVARNRAKWRCFVSADVRRSEPRDKTKVNLISSATSPWTTFSSPLGSEGWKSTNINPGQVHLPDVSRSLPGGGCEWNDGPGQYRCFD